MPYFTKPIDTKSITLDQILSQTTANNDCLEWHIGNDKNGYGRISIKKNRYKTTRVVCQLVYGEPTPNQQALHSCDNPPCINPDHLRWGTIQENHSEKVKRNRNKGENSTSKLKNSQVYEIKKMMKNGASNSEIMAKFGLSKNIVSNIRCEITWTHIKLSD